MNFTGLFEMQVTLFLVMLLGLLLRRCGLVDEGGKRLISDLVINVTLPASIVKSFEQEMTHEILMSCMAVIIAAVLIQIGCFLLGLVLYRGYGEKRKKVLQYVTICSNAGVLGNAIAEGIFGETGLLYASIYVVPQRIFMWSVGLTYFTEAPDRRTLVKKVATHPCIVAVVIGFMIMAFQVHLPGFLDQTIRTVANANTFLAMMLVGTILAQVNFCEMFEKSTIYYSFIRLAVIPFLVFAGCRLAGLDSLITGVSVVLSGMPAASSTAALASRYNKDEIFATKCVVLTTILSMVTVPVWCLLLAV